MAEEEKQDGEGTEEAKDGSAGEEGEGGESEGSEAKPRKFPARKLILIGGALLLLITIPAVLFFTGIIGPKHEEPTGETAAPQEQTDATEKEPIFYEMEEFLINLNTGGKQVKFLKMNVLLELSDQADVMQVEARLPRIRDAFQIYLRELRLEDLQGSKGVHRLREELLLRVNKELYPVKVNNILFKDILIQ
ncbi:MAG: Flagellar basal body-associated protein [Rickettsiales bacterium]|jgi:flagellar FliL protein|nr:Flagellar basal body-associated protein [Rickettsiales bacterium]